MDGGGVGDIVEDAGLADEVADHNEASTPPIEGTEEGFTYPVGELAYAVFILDELVIIEVIDDDVVGAMRAVAQTTGGLPTA